MTKQKTSSLADCPCCTSQTCEPLLQAVNTHGGAVWDGDETFQLYQCQDCQTVFLEPMDLSEAYYEKYYPKGYYGASAVENSSFMNRLGQWFSAAVWKKRKQLLIRLGGHNKKVLDIGCGSGDFLSTLGSDFDRTGLELNPEGAATCRQKGLKVYQSTLEEAPLEPNSFDWITLWHVLEHVEGPEKLLHQAAKLLAPGGRILIAVPHASAWGFLWGKEDWFHLDAPRHLFLPSQKGMLHLFERAGLAFERRIREAYDSPLDLFWSVRNRPIRLLVYPLYPFFKALAPETLTLVAQKAHD